MYGPSAISPLGHVAVVEQVYPAGKGGGQRILLSEMNNPYTPGGGFNHIDQRTTTTAGIIGYIVPPGSSYKATPAQTKVGKCVSGSITIPAMPLSGNQPTVICFDSFIGLSAMGAGAFLMFGGVLIMVALSFRNTAIGQRAIGAATTAAGAFGGPVGAAVAVSTRQRAPKAANPSPEGDKAAAAASTERTARAKARLSPEATRAVDEAKAGRGTKLSPSVKEELRAA